MGQLKATIDGHVRTVQEYERRLQAQAAHSHGLYKQKLAREVIEKAHQEHREGESHAEAELEEQLRSAEQHGSADWAARAQARYSEQIQQLHQAKEASIRRASELPVS